MPRAVSLSCPSCGGPLGGRGFVPLQAACAFCALPALVVLDVDGVPMGGRRPEASLTTLGRWITTVRTRIAPGHEICVGGCGACSGPLLFPAAHPLRLPCERCPGYREVAAGATVSQPLDGLSASLHASGPSGSFSIEYTLERVEPFSPGGEACSSCGAPVPPGHQSDACAYCRTRLWMVDANGRRYAYALAMRGRRNREQVNQRVPLAHAEQAIAGDVQAFESASGIIKGVGIAIAVVFGIFLVGGICIVGCFAGLAMAG